MEANASSVLSEIRRLRNARVRDSGHLTLAERARYRDGPARREHAALKSDPTLGAWMTRARKRVERRQRTLRAAAAAWRETVEMHLDFRVVLIDIQRNVLLVMVGSESERFRLDRVLRAGGERHFINTCRAPVSGVRAVTGRVPAYLVRHERRTRTIDEELAEVQAHLEGQAITPGEASLLHDAWERAVRDAMVRDQRQEREELTRRA